MVHLICPKCSERLQVPAEVAGGRAECPRCGNVAYVAPIAASRQPRCSRVVYILLAIFLGGLGIHNFVAGYTGRAVAQLLITLFTGWLLFPLLAVAVWVLVEICATTRDADGVRMN